MIKISHEAPNSIFKQVQSLTDFDYCLVHLLEENQKYLDLFKEAKKAGREIMLDNSIFELGEAFNSDKFAHWVEALQPTWFIVPDVLTDLEGTIDAYCKFIINYPKLPSKRIGVLQGKTYEELCTCYKTFVDLGIDKIAIPFHSPYYEEIYSWQPKLEAQMNGRRRFLWQLSHEEWFSYKIPLHLLGISLPQEYISYSNIPFPIDSMDSSNPVVHGLKGIRYTDTGLMKKENQKLFTLIDEKVSDEQWIDIKFNIECFKSFAQQGS